MLNRLNLVLFLIVFSNSLSSQNIRLNDIPYFIYEETFSSEADFHMTVKPFLYSDFIKFDSVKTEQISKKLIHKIFNEDLVKIKKDEFRMSFNPILSSCVLFDVDQNKVLNESNIGLSLKSNYKDRLSFSADYFISRTNFSAVTSELKDSIGIVPHFGKSIYSSNGLNIYHSLTGELAFKATDNLYFHLGKGKHFFGNGYRSLLLSDNSNSYPYFKVTADIWKIKYIWIAASLKDVRLTEDVFDPVLYNKAVFMHYFSLNLTKRININFFESVITNPYDASGIKAGYEWSYFNPVVFYRPIEFYNGTSDNSIMGLGLNLRLFQSVHLYTQFILDDLIISRLNDGSGWWGNKYGFQAGLKAYNFFKVKGLFIRGELNLVRPYTYAHGQSGENNDVANLNYGNYFQALAHPMGANFAEGIAQIKYRKGRLITQLQLNIAKKGIDNDTVSYGSNIYKSYNLRSDDYGTKFLQGTEINFFYTQAGASYILNPSWDLTLDAYIQYRKISDMNNMDNLYFSIGISTKVFNNRSDYF